MYVRARMHVCLYVNLQFLQLRYVCTCAHTHSLRLCVMFVRVTVKPHSQQIIYRYELDGRYALVMHWWIMFTIFSK